MKHLFLISVFSLFPLLLSAQSFDDLFEDATLRMDIILAGNDKDAYVYLDEYVRLGNWAGRRKRLSEIQNLGNARAIMRDAESGEIIYTTSFGMLFQEWQATDEAKQVNKAFQQVLLFPYPKKKAIISVDIRQYDGVFVNYLNAPVDPLDILIRPKGDTGYRKETIVYSGLTSDCIDIVFVGEGYTEEEQDKFFEDARRVSGYLFEHAPFDSQKDKFNVFAVGAVSRESGATMPAKNDWKNTIAGAHYDTFYSSRYLMSNKMKNIHDCIADVPYEQIIVLVNTPSYGGGGIYNSHTLVSADDKQTNIIVVHEFGHSFAGLADEYYYPGDVMENYYNKKIEPWEKNITTLIDFDSKWKDLLPEDTPIPTVRDGKDMKKLGVYEGGGYATKGIYSPVQDCRMKSNAPDYFCPVCTRALIEVVDFLTK